MMEFGIRNVIFLFDMGSVGQNPVCLRTPNITLNFHRIKQE